MDDIVSLDRPNSNPPKRGPSPNYSTFAALRPTPPTSGRSTPFGASTQTPVARSPAPANDSFSNLIPFSATSSQKNVSLLEQQKILEEQKRRKARETADTPVGTVWAGDEQFWNNLGSGRSTPVVPNAPQDNGLRTHRDTSHDRIAQPIEEDLLAVFNAPGKNGVALGSASTPQAAQKSARAADSSAARPDSVSGIQIDDDDDPFGLNELATRFRPRLNVSRDQADGDDDVLGLLGRPAEERPPPPPESLESSPSVEDAHPQDRALAELVEMGFPADKARQGLEQTESGVDVQAAVGWLLNQAHAEAKDRSRGRSHGRSEESAPSDFDPGPRRVNPPGGHSSQGFEEETLSQRRREHDSAASRKEKDPAQVASELGTAFLKSANSLWKQGTKKVQQAYQDFSSDSEAGGQPKWMRESAAPRPSQGQRQRPPRDHSFEDRPFPSAEQTRQASNVTDEVLMLELNGPPPRQPPRRRQEARIDSSADTSRDHSPAMPSRLRESFQPQPFASSVSATNNVPRSKPTRQMVEEQASQAYVSSARRRRPPATSVPAVTQSEADLLDGIANTPAPFNPASPPAGPSPRPAPPVAIRPQPPGRNIPPISAISLKASHSHREAGNAHFKRGDYSSAYQSYTTSLSHLPQSHPITLVLLTNHALTALKIGEPKAALSDADQVIRVIGPSKGASETVDLQNGESPKPMRDYYGKALMRKAEALEQMEKWSDAVLIWREAVEGGHGGATSIQARARCEKAANPEASRSKSAPPPRSSVRPTPRPAAARPPPSLPSTASAAAVRRLRAANAAADRQDDEKFALSDAVDARITAWKGGKADNLRALLASLDTVLGPEGESGWKKISMADLVLPGRVKVQYMKGIAKVHPDKIPTTATTEQRMIAGAVFSALNEAWDKFKAENGL